MEEEYTLDSQVYVPPEKKFIPWLLPRADNVLKAYGSDTSARLFADLKAYYQSMSELPSDAHYDLLVGFTLSYLHPRLSRGDTLSRASI